MVLCVAVLHLLTIRVNNRFGHKMNEHQEQWLMQNHEECLWKPSARIIILLQVFSLSGWEVAGTGSGS
jgi:hypothetical protein